MLRKYLSLILLLPLAGCASLISSVTSDMADNLNQAILNQNDLETVRAGAPAYLLMIDGMIGGDPDNTDLLLAGSKLYSSYTTVFVDDPERAQRLSNSALNHAKTALCQEVHPVCEALTSKQKVFEQKLAATDEDDVAVLYGFASAWAVWIQHNASDWNALADIPKLTAFFERLVVLDEGFDHGGSHLYLAVLASQLPPGLGGKPEKGLQHFQRAKHLSKGHNLMVDVFMAQYYARVIFDKALHDQLLQSVLDDPGDYPDFTLINAYARQQATELLAESAEYF